MGGGFGFGALVVQWLGGLALAAGGHASSTQTASLLAAAGSTPMRALVLFPVISKAQ